jgi:hypothetical protein
MANATLGYSMPTNNPAYKMFRVSGWMLEAHALEYLMSLRVDSRHLYFQPVSENPKKNSQICKLSTPVSKEKPLDRLIRWASGNTVMYRIVEVQLKGDNYTTVTVVFRV